MRIWFGPRYASILISPEITTDNRISPKANKIYSHIYTCFHGNMQWQGFFPHLQNFFCQPTIFFKTALVTAYVYPNTKTTADVPRLHKDKQRAAQHDPKKASVQQHCWQSLTQNTPTVWRSFQPGTSETFSLLRTIMLAWRDSRQHAPQYHPARQTLVTAHRQHDSHAGLRLRL